MGASTVIRFNGGAQAGHTVVDGEQRHVFGHLAAGGFAGAKTYLSNKFIFNPILLHKERAAVKGLSISGAVGVHPRARVSTIYDMVLNSIAELARGTDRHGSCGMGINETVTRHSAGYELAAGDLTHPALVRHVFQSIKDEWVPKRLEELLKDCPVRDEILAKYADVLNKSVSEHVSFLLECCSGIFIHSHRPGAAVFEGAQGLQLDEFLGAYPHVTRSITGMPYAIMAAAELGVKTLQPIYVTRCYTTRHGAGHLAHEGEEFSRNLCSECV